MCRICDIFSETFKLWRITIDDKDVFPGNQRYIPHRIWEITFIVQQDDRGIFLEYYGMNERGEHRHVRIYESGEEELLEVLQQYIRYSPNIPGDKERGTREFERYNSRILQDLRDKGLLA